MHAQSNNVSHHLSFTPLLLAYYLDDENIGIHRRTVKHIKRGRTYYRDIVEVTWTPEPGKVGRTTISVNKYGEEEAMRMAREIRREKERKLFGGTIY